MKVIINDRPTEIPDGATVALLLQSLGFAPDRVAVERNGEIVPKPAHESAVLQPEDRLEVVQFVGGG